MNGFLGTGAPLVVDVIVVALAAALPLLLASIVAASRGHTRLHKTIQISLSVILALALIAFEIQISQAGWKEMAGFDARTSDDQHHLTIALGVHLIFAISTPPLWIAALAATNRGRAHRVLGRLAAADLTMTAITGWYWYYTAFIAT